jgi:polar amino acid transport system substrate-binding protein
MTFLKTIAVAALMTATAGSAIAQEASKLQQVLDRGYMALH